MVIWSLAPPGRPPEYRLICEVGTGMSLWLGTFVLYTYVMDIV